ncbi:putative retrotransposon protein [Klebsormidium nitens]|uniref:Putative retrotransposon protein n=1 Tax=Klebsormidium nitens TaxID=105231 RepID=A0A1Y1I3L6_KLENI|nr:putative retrotransposon protein [Klebsormidium nitens]|eukprot:GAQ84542.1 putative retrotransposon protein [Klebsormidium nitens]
MVDVDPGAQGGAALQAAIGQLTEVVAEMAGQMQHMQAQLEEQRATAAAAGGAGVPPMEPAAEAQVPAAGVPGAGIPGGKNLRLRFSEVYDGSSTAGAVENFIFDYEMYFEGMDTPVDKQVYLAAGLLTGSAKSWWRYTGLAHGGNQTLYSWDAFSGELLSRFRAVNSTRHARDKLAGLRQDGSVRTYAQTMQESSLQVPGIQDEELLDRFIRGLKPRTRQEVIMREPETFEEAVKLADRYDSLWGSAGLQSGFARPTFAANGVRTSRVQTPLSFSNPAPTRQPGHLIAECPNKPPVQRTVAQGERPADPTEHPNLIDFGLEEPRCSENSLPQ